MLLVWCESNASENIETNNSCESQIKWQYNGTPKWQNGIEVLSLQYVVENSVAELNA